MLEIFALSTSFLHGAALIPCRRPSLQLQRHVYRIQAASTDHTVDFYDLYDSCCAGGQTEYEGATAIFGVLKEECASGDAPRWRKKKAAKVLTKAMSACGRKRQWQEAIAILNEMQAQGLEPDTRAYNAALSA